MIVPQVLFRSVLSCCPVVAHTCHDSAPPPQVVVVVAAAFALLRPRTCRSAPCCTPCCAPSSGPCTACISVFVAVAALALLSAPIATSIESHTALLLPLRLLLFALGCLLNCIVIFILRRCPLYADPDIHCFDIVSIHLRAQLRQPQHQPDPQHRHHSVSH